MGDTGRRPPDSDDLISQSYQLYFKSGHYDRRYPSPNRTMWRLILRHLTPQSSVIDFGCGSGRYLLRTRGLVARAAGFDISPAALALVRARAEEQGWDDLAVLGPDPDMLGRYVAREGRADLVLCLFGVLGHIARAEDRQDALARMRAALKPGSGRLLISVPNIARRFRTEQRAAGPGAKGLVQYARVIGGDRVNLKYQLFDTARLTRELAQAGFTIHAMGCESVLPESWLLNWKLARWTDAVLTPLCGPSWGYGIYAEASY